MKIQEFGTLQMIRTDEQHYGVTGSSVLKKETSDVGLLHTTEKTGKKIFSGLFV